MNTQEVELELFQLMGRGRRALALPDDRLREDLAIDSVAFVRLVIDIERKFNIRFDDDMLTVNIFEKAGSLSQYVMSLIAEQKP
jgi:acyl carrier protein